MKKYILKKDDDHGLVRVLQNLLGISETGIFDLNTLTSVKSFQKINGLVPDGIVGPITWKSLDYDPREYYADTDRMTSSTWIEKYELPDGEYVKKETKKEYIFLHHTAGTSNPYDTIDNWASDDRGRIGTHYVIGGIDVKVDVNNLENFRLPHDGKILQAIPDQYFAYHLGKVRSYKMHTNSISIELCSSGYLKEKNGKFMTWYGEEVHPSQVEELVKPFRGYKYFHKYSDAQLKSLEALLFLISDKHGIDLSKGLPQMLSETKDVNSAFEYDADINAGRVKGLISHTNVRTGKVDIVPQKGMVYLLRSLMPVK